MGSERGVLTASSFDDHLGLPDGVEDLSIKEFVSEFPIEALAVSIFPRAPRSDEEGSYTCSFKAAAYRVGSEFWAVI